MANQRFTAEQVIAALEATQGLPALAADKLKCTVSTLYNYAERYPSVKDAMKHHKEKRIDMAEGKLWGLINDGNVTAIIFYLKTQAKDRGYVERQEVTGADNSPLRIVVEHERANGTHKDS